LKKPTDSIRFRFYKSETEKNEPNQTQTEKKPKKTEPKPSQTKKTERNRFETVFVLKTRTETSRFEPFWFFKKKSVWLLFLYIKTKPKMITPSCL
jgi:hypothetical protein